MNPGPTTSQRLRPFKPLRFGRYTLLMPLSTGGMGEIYLARLEGSHGFDKLCVIKKILPHLAQDPQFVERFVDEAHILVKLSHGSIAQVLDMGVHDGAPYIALEFVDGKDLRRVLQRMRDRKLPLPLSFVLSVVTRVLDALAYAHRKRDDQDHELNLVHRDVSPQNVLISYEGEVKVIDFGLAKSTQSASRTNPSIVLGKFMYMAPEQARHKTVDRRSDLYAVGLCLWELVTGKNPFEDVPPGEIMAQVATPTIPALNTVEPLCPMALSDAVARALAVDPAQRFQTAEEFRGKLQAILQQIDPLAGAESTSRFMRDAFATEYQFERRMLTTVKEQARALAEAAAVDVVLTPSTAEETLDNAPSPFAAGARPTPIATPAIALSSDLTPLAPRAALAGPTPLSFQPTRKTTSGVSRAHEEHEKETLPSIPLKTDLALASPPPPPAAAPAPVSAPGPAPATPAAFLPTPMLGQAPSPAPPQAQEKIRARVLVKSFDQEATEAAAPALAEPEPLPSIVIDGLPSEPVRTDLEVPSQEAPLPPPSPAPRSTRAPAGKKPPKISKPPGEKPRASRDRLEKTGEKPMPRVSRPPPAAPPQRTDTQVLDLVAERAAAPSAAPSQGNDRWLWFAVPLIAIAGLGALIAWDIHTDRQRAEQEQPAPEPEASPVKPAPPAPPRQRLTTPELPPTPAPEPVKDDGSKRRSPAPATSPKAARPAASPGAAAVAELQRDYDALVDDAAQRKFRLQLSALQEQVEAQGDQPAFVRRVQALHAQVKTALAKQQ